MCCMDIMAEMHPQFTIISPKRTVFIFVLVFVYDALVYLFLYILNILLLDGVI